LSREDSNITWITCPDCGAKVGIVISVGKTAPTEATIVGHTHVEPVQSPPDTPPVTLEGKLTAAGIDVTLVDVSEEADVVSITPKKFLGDLWSPINDSVRTLGGNWVRDGRQSRWEIPSQNLG
jgi:hypothetical protein